MKHKYTGFTHLLQDISALGTDDWYDIVSLDGTLKGKPKAVGKCHLRMSISYKQVFKVLLYSSHLMKDSYSV